MDNAQQFKLHLIREEKSEATVEKYVRDTQRFLDYANGEILTKELAMEYKEYFNGLLERYDADDTKKSSGDTKSVKNISSLKYINFSLKFSIRWKLSSIGWLENVGKNSCGI